MERLTAYKVVKNKHYFRDGSKKMVVTKKSPQHYVVTGDEIRNKLLDVFTDETINYSTVKIERK